MSTDYSDLALLDTGADTTMELGTLIAMGFTTDDDLHLSAAYYPLHDEAHRDTLNRRILEHYRLREIGMETPQAFVFYLGRTMAEIMPYYNQMYALEDRKYDPLVSVDMWGTSDSENTGESSARNTSDGSSTTHSTSESDTVTDNSAMTVGSQFPQTRLDDFRKYATEASQTDSHGNSHTTGSQDSTSHNTSEARTDFQHSKSNGKGTTHSSGRSQSGASLIMEARAAVLNIDMMVVNELERLFMQTWGSGDAMTTLPTPPATYYTGEYPYMIGWR